MKLRKDESIVTAVPTKLSQDCKTYTCRTKLGVLNSPLWAFSPAVAMWTFWKAFPCGVEDGGEVTEGVVVEGGGGGERGGTG